MKCHAGIEFPSGKPCPKCNAKLGEVCWPGINADLLELARLRKDNERLRAMTIEECAKVAEEALVGRTLTPGGLALQDEAKDIAARIRSLAMLYAEWSKP